MTFVLNVHVVYVYFFFLLITISFFSFILSGAWRRLEIFKEIINSERICLGLLKVMKLYKTELGDSNLCELLFTHTDKMLKLHQRILDKLLTFCGEVSHLHSYHWQALCLIVFTKKQQKTWEFDFSGIAAGLVKLVPKFSIYIDYTKAFKRTINLLDTNIKSNKEFADRIEEVRLVVVVSSYL